MSDGEYKPEWLMKEIRVEKTDPAEDLELFCHDDDIGLLAVDCLDEPVEGEAAFLFGETADDLWFRHSYASLARIRFRGDEDRKIAERLFRSDYGVYWGSSDGEDGEKFPVYRNALDLLPLFHTSPPRLPRVIS